MSDQCAECGAMLPSESTCQTIFDEFLSLESTNKVYGEVLDLTVACFMIQHGRYSDSALTWMQSKLRADLDEQPGQGAAPGLDDATRIWKFTRQADERPLPKIAWSMTIVDVTQSIQDPEKYCEQVKQWAQATLKQMDGLFQKSSPPRNEMPSRNGMLSRFSQGFTKTPFIMWLNEKSPNPLVRSYLVLRQGIGVIGVALPIVLIVGTIILERNLEISGSISSYYYRVMGDVFVGSLWAIGIFLICYQYERLDDIASTVAGVCAIGVSLFPTTNVCPPSHMNCVTGPQMTIGAVHTVFASLFFGILAFMVLVLFTRKNPIPDKVTKRKQQRNTAYFICGGIMLACIVLMLLILIVPNLQWLQSHHSILMLEAFADFAFGAAWFIKGETFILKDKDPQTVLAVGSVQNDATSVVASTLGILAGLLGLVHGCLETVQVSAPSGILIHAMGSPCQANMAWHLCFPAITIIPNFFITGVLAIIVSVIVIIWAALFVQRKNGGLVLIVLAIIQLLVGGGYISFTLCFIAGLVGTRIQNPFTWWLAHPSFLWQSFLAKWWPWSLIFPVIPVAGYVIHGFFVNEFLLMLYLLTIAITLGLLLLAVLSAFAHDMQQRQTNTQQAPSVAVELPQP